MKNSVYGHLIALLAGACVASGAVAGIPVTPGNVPQKKCDVGHLDPITRMGSVRPGGTVYSVADRRMNLGKPLSSGDMVYYVSLTEGTKVYRTEKQIEIIDASPLTPDMKLTPQDQLSIAGTFTSSAGQKFDLIAIGSTFNKIFAMVDESGFICSERLDEKLIGVGMPTTYQEFPLKAVILNPGQPRTVSVAVTFMGLTGASATFQVAVMVNGKLETSKVSSFDVFAPSTSIGDLNFSMKAEDGRMTITSLNEPEDYNAWMMMLRKRR